MTGCNKSMLPFMTAAILHLACRASSFPQTIQHSNNDPRPPLDKQIKQRQKQRYIQQAESTSQICSCSPTKIQIILSLSQSCNDNDFKSNPGIQESYCFIDDDFDEDDLPSSSSSSNKKYNNGQREGSNEINDNDTLLSEPIRRTHRQRRNQVIANNSDDDAIPVEIISVQYLEFHSDGNLKVIDQDDTYTNVSLVDGDSLTYYSTSSYLDGSLSLEDQLEEFVPGGASLILYGRTSSGRLVRNRFFWVYSNSCEEGSDETVLEGDKVGWVTIGSGLGGPWPAFCPQKSIVNSPTISPRTTEPTYSPMQYPTKGESDGDEGEGEEGGDDREEGDNGEEGENVNVDSATFMPTTMPASFPDDGTDQGSDGGGSPTSSNGNGHDDDVIYDNTTSINSSDTGSDDENSGGDGDSSGGGAKSQKPSVALGSHDDADTLSFDLQVNSKSHKPLFGKPGKPSDDHDGANPFGKSSKSHSGKSDKSSKKYFRSSSSSKSGKSGSAKWVILSEDEIKSSLEGYPYGGVDGDDYGDVDDDYYSKPGMTRAYKTMSYAYDDYAHAVDIEDVDFSEEDIRR